MRKNHYLAFFIYEIPIIHVIIHLGKYQIQSS